MRKYILIVFLSLTFFSCFAQTFSVNENYEDMRFEIYKDEKIYLTLQFRNYCGYQIIDNKIFFIDCSKSNISEYGEICYFDCKNDDFIYTGIFSGSSFYLSKNSKYMVVSSLLNVSQQNDIVDVFGLEIPSKKFPFNIEIYEFDSLEKIQEFSFYDKIEKEDLNFLYIQIIELSDNELEIKFGIFDTTKKIHAGVIDLKSMSLKTTISHQ